MLTQPNLIQQNAMRIMQSSWSRSLSSSHQALWLLSAIDAAVHDDDDDVFAAVVRSFIAWQERDRHNTIFVYFFRCKNVFVNNQVSRCPFNNFFRPFLASILHFSVQFLMKITYCESMQVQVERQQETSVCNNDYTIATEEEERVERGRWFSLNCL